MVITNELRKEIEVDIERCKNHTKVEGSESLYSELVSKYVTIDNTFSNNLSTNGKATALGKEFDYRKELSAIAAKLNMWLLVNPIKNSSTKIKLKIKERVSNLITCGEEIKESEFHPAKEGFLLSFVSGPKFDAWMNEINIFNARFLKQHPLYQNISSTLFNYKKKSSSCDEMLGYLRAILADEEFFQEEQKVKKVNRNMEIKSIEELLADDISSCNEYLSSDSSEDTGRELYLMLTSRYDNIINDFGSGLYSYIPNLHFYDTEIDVDTLNHNLKILLHKMVAYQAVNFSSGLKSVKRKVEPNNKIFIVHGHDDAAKNIMARALENASFEVIILHEQPSNGRTIIEKIEMYTDVTYAVVLYTPCDLGRSIKDNIDNQRYRARQNVVFEHGYLLGKLGRDRVTALVKGSVETPGDISGVIYINMDDAGAWKAELARNMKAVGVPIDLNTFLK